MLTYEVTRIDGNVQRLEGDNAWEMLLTHEDVTEPGRIKQFKVLGADSPVTVDLRPDETLIFARRTRISLGAGSQSIGIRTFVGKLHTNGHREVLVIMPDGFVTVARNSSGTD